jgi:hypothetical protein
MRRASALALALSACALVATQARAQPPTNGSPPRPTENEADTTEPIAPEGTLLAPRNAFELQFLFGYVQPFGELSETVEMSELAGPGFTGGGALAWRINPHFAAVGYGGWGHWAGADELNDGKAFALGPLLSADVNVLPWDLNTTTGNNSSLDEPGINTFFFAGVAGRHDLLGSRVAKGQDVAAFAARSSASR